MRGQPGPAGDPYATASRRVRRVALAASLIWLLVGICLLAPLSADAHRLLSGSAIVIGGIGLAVACFVRYREGIGRRQVAWMLFTLAAVAGAFANGWLTLVGPLRASPGSLSPNEVAVAVGLLLAMLGFGFFTSTTRTGLGLIRMVLDGVVLGGSVILIAQDLVRPELFANVGLESLIDPSAGVAPLIDLVIATIAGLQFLRVGRMERPAMGLACAGFLAFASSDLASIGPRSAGDFTLGTAADLGTIAGYLLLALGVAWPVAPLPDGIAEETTRSAIRGTLITFGIFVVAAGVHVWRTADLVRLLASDILLIAVLLAVAGRQVLLILDNERLRQTLEQRVRDRNIELREVTQRTDLLVDSVGDGVYGVDVNGVVTFVNPAAAQVLGYRPRELMGRSAHVMFHARAQSGTDHDLANCYITQVIASGRAASGVEDTYEAKDARLFPVEVTASPLARDSRARGAVVVFRDVTQRREVDRLKSEFVSMVSHELKTPLTAIRGSLGLLAGGALGELASPARRMVEIAMDSGERLTRLINQILDLERIESGTSSISIRPHRAVDLVQTAVAQLEVLTEEQGLTVVAQALEGTVLADDDQVDQMLLNLLGNAVKFSPPGGEIQVGAAMTGNMVEFWVNDQGRGVPPDQLEAIFTRFHQVDSSDARDKGGTGLGLAISRSIVDRLGGRIWAENAPGGGATFRFTLPAAPAVSVEEDDDPSESYRPRRRVEQPTDPCPDVDPADGRPQRDPSGQRVSDKPEQHVIEPRRLRR